MDEIYSIKSTETDVWKNLAFENCLTDYVSEKYEQEQKTIAILFLWQNDKTVVIGKHQNPYKECNLEFVKNNNIKIARRITGGGAVYHDKGNLNFSFIQSKNIYNKESNFEIIKNALKNIGINAEISGRNDILIEGKKFSGNAFYTNKNCALHHGTILINSCSDVISKCLTPNKFKLKSKGVSSVSSRITNLKEYYPKVSVRDIKNAIDEEFEKVYNVKSQKNILIDNTKWQSLYEKYSSKKWIFNDYIDDGLEISEYFNWGEITMFILLKDNVIKNINIFSDAIDTDIIDKLSVKLQNIKFDKISVINVFNSFEKNLMTEDIKNLILNFIKKSFMIKSSRGHNE